MSEQLSFAEFGAAPPLKHGLFFALFPEPGAASCIERFAWRLRGEYGLSGAPLETERLHISLHHVGDYADLPRDVVAAARKAAATVAAPSFEVAFDRVMSFGRGAGNLPLVLCAGDDVAQLTSFQQALGAAMSKAGLGRRARSRYVPHVTMLYDRQQVVEQRVDRIAWTVREFVLVHSLIGASRYVRLGCWPLRG
jgi:2'-5' RNA ligase